MRRILPRCRPWAAKGSYECVDIKVARQIEQPRRRGWRREESRRETSQRSVRRGCTGPGRSPITGRIDYGLRQRPSGLGRGLAALARARTPRPFNRARSARRRRPATLEVRKYFALHLAHSPRRCQEEVGGRRTGERPTAPQTLFTQRRETGHWGQRYSMPNPVSSIWMIRCRYRCVSS